LQIFALALGRRFVLAGGDTLAGQAVDQIRIATEGGLPAVELHRRRTGS